MKKTMKFLIGLITAIMITGVVSAQHGNAPAGHVTIGVKGGLNLYNIHNDNNISYDQRVGFNIGLLGHIHRDSHWASVSYTHLTLPTNREV